MSKVRTQVSMKREQGQGMVGEKYEELVHFIERN